jgi:hypothetical protein
LPDGEIVKDNSKKVFPKKESTIDTIQHVSIKSVDEDQLEQAEQLGHTTFKHVGKKFHIKYCS